MRKVLLLLASLVLVTAALGQNQMTITSTNIPNAFGVNLASGQACLLATLNDGTPTGFTYPGGGTAQRRAVCTGVTSGAFTAHLPNVLLTNPSNVCFKLTVKDTSNGQTVVDLGYECLQPSPSAYWCSGSACNLDNFIPNLAPLTAVTPGPQGIQGPTGAAATIALGTVTTGAPGTSAAITNSGTSGAAVFNFTLPLPSLASPGAIGGTTPAPVNGTTYSVSGTPLASTHLNDSGSLVRTSTTVNGHPLSSNVVVSASDLTTGTTPASAEPAHTGDMTNTAGSLATAVVKVNGGAVPVSANSVATNSSGQFMAGTAHNQSVPANCVSASGSGTAYTCTSSPTFTPATGDHIQFKADVANTGSATLNVNGAGAATIKKWGGSGNLIANDLLAAHWISATFDGTYWQLEGQLGNAPAQSNASTTVNGVACALGSSCTVADSTKLATGGGTMTGKLTTVASSTGSAGVNLPHGSAPTTPTNGDCWTTTAGFYCQINGATVGPYATSAGSMTNPMTAVGDTVYGGASGAATRLAGPTAASMYVYTSTGSGSAATAPTWTQTTVNRWEQASFYAGAPASSAFVYGYAPGAATVVSIPSACTNCKANASVAATASTTFTIYKCTAVGFSTCSSVGTLVFAAAAKTGTFTVSSAFTLTGSANESIYIGAPSTADATLANVGITLVGTKN